MSEVGGYGRGQGVDDRGNDWVVRKKLVREEVMDALKIMKSEKAAGFCGTVVEML